ncbi:MAG TPA: Fe-S cluster assembly protein SufD [Pseudomonadales bacterium]|nr:Fe-S cluster assembly protein SufD [Pseudomonadales bacterium]
MNSLPSLQSLTTTWADQQSLAQQPALAKVQTKARAQLRAMPFPDRKTEAWKYTSLHALQNPNVWKNGVATAAVSSEWENESAVHLRFVNGQLQQQQINTETVKLTAFSELSADELARYLPLMELNDYWQAHPFAQLNEATVDQSWLLVVKANQRINGPIVLEQWASGESAFAANLRVLVVVEANAEATLVQVTECNSQAETVLLNGLLQIQVNDNASLNHIQLQLAAENCLQAQGSSIRLARDSRYQHFAVQLGSNLIRNDLYLQFMQPGAEANLQGAFLCKHSQHIDNHLTLEHISGRCQSTTRYKGLVTDQGKAVFNGRIHIHPNAQKTDAQLNNRNLLLSDQAEINTKPELEIYADDVKCAHGASIGQLSENSLFYFESRGIDKATAEAMLSFGFVNEIVEQLPIEWLADAVSKRLVSYFRDVKQLGGLWQL